MGELAEYNYTPTGAINSVTFNAQDSTYSGVFEYQDRDWVSDVTYKSESQVTLFDIDYIHDDAGNIDSLSYTNVSETDNVGYDYDNLNRLTKATSSTHADYEYAYDKNGNIDSTKIDGTTKQYTYATGKPNRLTQSGSNVLDYDANGNIDSYNGGNELLHYDHRNQLDWYEGSQDEYYDYDAAGLRVYKEGEGTSYGENFNDNDVDDGDPTDWYKTGSYWSASAGELKWTSSGYASGQCSNPDLQYDDFVAEFDLMADGYYTTSYWAAFAFRKTSHSDWYSTSGYMVYYRYNGSIVLYEAGYGDLASSSTGKDLSTWRHVKIEASGSTIKVYVDGTLEINKSDATYTNGYFGFNVFGVKARYDNLTMYDDTKVYYVRDVNGDILAEYDFAGNLLAEYVYANGQRIAKMTAGGSEDIYLNDHLGSARALTESGWSASYYPFGEVASQTGSSFDTRFDFTGQERDQGTGLMYFGARFYDPVIGRWLSVDPLAEKFPGWSPYNYALNNPVGNFDPDGRDVRFAAGDSADAATLVSQLNEMHEGAGFRLRRDGEFFVLAIGESSTFDFHQNKVTRALFDVVSSTENTFSVAFLNPGEKAKGQPGSHKSIEDAHGGWTQPDWSLSGADHATFSLRRDGFAGESMGQIFLHESVGHGHPAGSEYMFEGTTAGGLKLTGRNPYGAINISWHYGSKRGTPRMGHHGGFNKGIKWKSAWLLHGPFKNN